MTLASDGAGAGLDLGGRVAGLGEGALWLFLVSPEGDLYDLSAQATRGPDGSARFGVRLGAATGPAYLLVALVSAAPLAAVAALPSGAASGPVLEQVLAEIMRGNPSVAAQAVVVPVP